MLGAILAFEVKKRFGMLSTYVYFVALLACAFLSMIAAGGAFSGVSVGMGSEKVYANAPQALHGILASLSHFGLLTTAAAFGQAVYQDYENRTDALFFTTPVRKSAYLGGRFLGIVVFATFVFSGLALGAFLGTKMWFVERSSFGPGRFIYYLWPYVTTILPNMIFTGAIFFALAALTRKMMPVYVGSVVMVLGYLTTGALLRKIEHKTLAGLIDPFGMRALGVTTEYWSVTEQNTQIVPLNGVFLANRVLWLAVGLLVLGFTFSKFQFAHPGVNDRAQREPAASGEEAVEAVAVRPTPDSGLLALVAGMTWLSLKETVKNVYFGVIVFAGVIFMVIISFQTGALYGTNTYPVTHSMLEVTGGTFGLFILILITFYSGELTWRERDARMESIADALPVPTWLPFVSKLLSLIALQGVLLAVIMVTSLAIQTFKGYHHYELGLYAEHLFGISLLDYALTCVLAMTVQAVVQHKYVGHFVMVLYYLAMAFTGKLGLEHNLYKYGSAPSVTYSDMNGYGHLLRPVLWFDAYWALMAVLLAVASSLLWARGKETGLRRRLAEARRRASWKVNVAAGVLVALFVGLGGFIFYNTNVLNRYRTSRENEAHQADFEKKYKHLAKVPQPRVVDVKVNIDIQPKEQALRARGTYLLENKTQAEIKTVYVNLPDYKEFQKLALAGLPKPTTEDIPFGFHTFELAEPMKPGDVVPLQFDLEFRPKGFKNDSQPTAVVENGTFFNSGALPSIGYHENSELSDDNSRKKYGLAAKERMADLNDAEARKNNYITPDADWVNFAATVSTDPDQIAIAPGYLQREWNEGGRRYFEYKMDSKILMFFSVLSARYQVMRDKWHDVALEIYYHPGHEYDLASMMKGMKLALEYYSASFGPYQHRQVRILEFPRYATFAQSFPNTIPYSEAIGFIAKVDPDNPEDIDYPVYITAHEVAHQWWAHQVIGGNVQGATMTSETMAQYSALMVMKKALGPDKMRRFLRYELDKYLIGRALERKKEVPLERVENQGYIHYQKGSLVMYELQDAIGEDAVNRALSAYLKAVKFQEPPYTNAAELVSYLKKETPPEFEYLIHDLFETITFYDNRAVSANATKKGAEYEVTIKVTSKKMRAGELGKEEEVPVDDVMDVGVVDEHEMPILIEKHRLKAGQSELTLTVNRPPAKAGIDPLNKLIDRKPKDNLIKVVGL